MRRGGCPFEAVPSVGHCACADTSDHPNAKPLALMRYLVGQSSSPRGLVLDPFTGSGTTLLTAKISQRPFIGIELDTNYVTIARSRLAKAHHVYPRSTPTSGEVLTQKEAQARADFQREFVDRLSEFGITIDDLKPK